MYKEFFEGKKLIVFDLDGTVIQSTKVWDKAVLDVAKRLNQNVYLLGDRGIDLRQRWEFIIRENALSVDKSIEELVALTKESFLRNLGEIEVTEGFWPFAADLKIIRKYKIGLVTNTSRVLAQKILETLELTPVFDITVCGDEVKNPKPNPEIYKKALNIAGVKSKEALAFEDSLSGCIASAKAGIKTICVWDGRTPKSKFPDEVIEFTSDFTPFLGELDTSYYEDILKMAQEEADKQDIKIPLSRS